MASLPTIITSILLATILPYYLLTTYFRTRRASQAAQTHGCKPIPRVQSRDPILGLDTFIKIQKADAAGHRSEAYRELHQQYGSTFLMNSLGTELQTSHAENIQAICTSSFNDWGVGPMRGTIGLPFLGRGIFTGIVPPPLKTQVIVQPLIVVRFQKMVNSGNIQDHSFDRPLVEPR